MARPGGWDVLGLEGDPTPGVVESVQALAKQFHGFADDAESAWRNLNSFGADTTAMSWIGQSGDAFKENFGPLPGRMQKLYTSYREAGDALDAYWPKLQAAQSKADHALRDGLDAHADVQRMTGLANTAADNLKQAQTSATGATVDPNKVKDAQTAHDTAQHNLNNANSRLSADMAAANGAHDDRIAAAQECAKALHHAQSDGIHNKHWWEHLGEALSDFGGMLAEYAGDVAMIAGALAPFLDMLALATSWIPGVDVITAGLAAADNVIADVAGVLATAGAVMQMAGDTMQGHFGDALLDAGMLGAMFVGGRLLGKMADGAEGDAAALKGAENDAGRGSQAAGGNRTCKAPGDPVDVVTGQMITDETDLALPGVLPLVLRRAYASAYGTGRLFGPGWSSTLDQRLSVNAAGIHFVGDDAQTMDYPVPGPGDVSVLASAGARWPLVWDRDTDEIRITDPETGEGRHFAVVHYHDERGQIRDLTAISDRNGNRINILRDADGTPNGIAHSGGYQVGIDTVHTSGGIRVARLRLLDGTNGELGTNLKSFGYDERGRLTGVVDSSGIPYVYEHDGLDRVTAWIDRVGYRYEYEYGADGRVVRATGQDGFLSVELAYDDSARNTAVTNSLGVVAEYHHDENGHVDRIADGLGHVVLYSRDAFGRLLSVTDQLGATTRYTLDEGGAPILVTDAAGGTTSISYDAQGHPALVTEPGGAEWRYAYDERGNLAETVDPLGAATRYAYDAAGALAQVIDPADGRTLMTNDSAGLPVSVTDAAGAVWTTTRDARGLVRAQTDPLGAVTVIDWDSEGRLRTLTHPDGGTEAWTWDPNGALVAHTTPGGGTTRYEVGPFGQQTARTDPDGARHTFVHDTELRLLKVTNPQRLVWNYTYDLAGRLIGETDFNGRAVNYTLDPDGAIAGRTIGAGAAVELGRDILGRVVEQRTADGTRAVYEYDARGDLVRARSADCELIVTRDLLGRIVSETVDGRTVEFTYDALGRKSSRTTPTGRVSAWRYDAAGRPASLSGDGYAFRFAHDAAGRESHRWIGAQTALTREWDSAGRLSGLRLLGIEGADASGAAAVPRILHERTWTYRSDGAVATMADPMSGLRRFDLDRSGRVTAVHAATWSEQYAYDAAGNVTQSADTRFPDADTAGAREVTGTLLHRAGRTHYEYDGQGRLVKSVRRLLTGGRKTWTYTYDALDRLVGAVTPDGDRWQYRYDPLGRRIAKARHGADGTVAELTRFSWDGAVPAEEDHAEADSGLVTATSWEFEAGSWIPLAQDRRTYYAHAPQETVDRAFHAIVADTVGTPVALVGQDGGIAWQRSAGLWGGAGVETGNASCPLRFAGQYHDRETGLDYNFHRYYDSATGRYTTPDPLGLAPAPNDYAYVDNPLGWIDPLGLAKAAPKPPNFAVDSNGDVTRLHTPGFVEYNGQMFPVPDGAYGPLPVKSGKGFQYIGGKGGKGMDPKVTGVRFMDPVTGGAHPHPDGYANYMNKSGQTVDRATGKTIAKNDPAGHLDACP
jgi:RHS repeat-associated protein